jgi:hypothetical protein
MKRLLVCMLAAGCVLALTGVALAVVKRGTYSGRTEAGDPLQFKVDRQKRVHSFVIVDVHLRCSDGDELDTGTVRTPSGRRFRTNRRGRWGFNATANNGANGYQVRGRIRSPNGNGTVRFFARFNEQNQLDPNGSIVCDSGTLDYTVKKR